MRIARVVDGGTTSSKLYKNVSRQVVLSFISIIKKKIQTLEHVDIEHKEVII